MELHLKSCKYMMENVLVNKSSASVYVVLVALHACRVKCIRIRDNLQVNVMQWLLHEALLDMWEAYAYCRDKKDHLRPRAAGNLREQVVSS